MIMASTVGEIKTEALPYEGNREIGAAYEYFKEEDASPIANVAGQGIPQIRANGLPAIKFLPIGE